MEIHDQVDEQNSPATLLLYYEVQISLWYLLYKLYSSEI